MATLCLLGVLGWVAWTAYEDYRGRKYVAAGIKLAGEARAAVEKAFAAGGPADFSATAATGWSSPGPNSVVRTIVIGKSGAITVRFGERVAAQGSQELQIVPVAGGKALDLSLPSSKGRSYTWECGGSAGRTSVPEKLRPDCR